jgi:hypothetical protein
MRAVPVTCSAAPLETVLKMMNFADLLKQVSITQCVTLELAKGGSVVAYVQDALVPGLNTDAKIGRPVNIYADFLGPVADADRSRSAPMILVNRFEPRGATSLWAQPPFSASINLAAFASSTLLSSLRLAGGSSVTPLWRGITCMCR